MTTEKSRLLAEFVGLKNFVVKPNGNILEKGKVTSYNYSNDWNALMELVEKIRRIDQTAKGEFKAKLLHYQRNNKTIFGASILENKEQVLKLGLEFVKWYNENPAKEN